jgi:hypothetical protein
MTEEKQLIEKIKNKIIKLKEENLKLKNLLKDLSVDIESIENALEKLKNQE